MFNKLPLPYTLITIAAQSARSRLDNFAHAERSSPAANAREASRTLLRSCHTPRLLQRHAPREQCSASAKEFARGVSQRRRRLCALRWVAPRLLRRGISTALRVGAVAALPKFSTSSGFHATAAIGRRVTAHGVHTSATRVGPVSTLCLFTVGDNKSKKGNATASTHVQTFGQELRTSRFL